jgi:hypothetical protein
VIQGNLDRFHLGDLLQWLQMGRLSGRLTLIGRNSKRHLDLLEGDIVYVSSTVPDERLATWLASEGLLPVAQLQQLLAVSLLRRTLFTNLLIDNGGFDPDNLRHSLTRLAETITCRVLAETDVQFVLDPDYPVRQLLGLTLQVEPNTLMLEAARRTDENGDSIPPGEEFPTDFCGEAFENFFWEVIRTGITDGDRVDGEELATLQQLIRDITGVLSNWLTSSPGLVPIPRHQADLVGSRLVVPELQTLINLPHVAWNQMVLACAIRSPLLHRPETLQELTEAAYELGLWDELIDRERWLRPPAGQIDEFAEVATAAWTDASVVAADHLGVTADTARLAVHLITVPTDLVLWVLSTLPVPHRRLRSTLVRELPRRLGRSLAHMADFPAPIRQLFDGASVTSLGACLHLGRQVLPSAHVWPETVPKDESLLLGVVSPAILRQAAAAVNEAVEQDLDQSAAIG